MYYVYISELCAFLFISVILNPSDFEFLLSKGDSSINNQCRNSILERFDPLLGPRTSFIQPSTQHTKFLTIAEADYSVDTTHINDSNATLLLGDTKLDSIHSNCGDDSRTSSSSETYVTASIEDHQSKKVNTFFLGQF